MVSRAADSFATVRFENLLLALVEQAAGLERLESYPIGLIFDPSSACGLRCPMCPVSYEPGVRAKTVLRWDLFERIIDEVGPYLLFVDFFNWGEPLLNKRLPDMVAKLKSFDIEVRISSSLSVDVPDAVLASLVETGVDWITVSIDGFSQASYETYRVRGDLKLALRNLARLAQIKREHRADRPFIDWQYLVFKFNEHEIEQARQFADEIGVSFRPAAPYINLDRYPQWLSTKDEFVMDRYKRVREFSPPASTTPASPPRSAAGPSSERLAQIEKLANAPPKRCDWHYLVSVVNANGSISPCCATQEEHFDFGSVADKPFREVWNNEQFRRVRRFFATGGYSRLAESKDLLCYDCIVPEDQGRAEGYVLRHLQSAPSAWLDQARRVLPPCWRERLPVAGDPAPAAPRPLLQGSRERDTRFELDVSGLDIGTCVDFKHEDGRWASPEGFGDWRDGTGQTLCGKGSLWLRIPRDVDHFVVEGVAPQASLDGGDLVVAVWVRDQLFAEVPVRAPGAFAQKVAIPSAVAAPHQRTFVRVALAARLTRAGESEPRSVPITLTRVAFRAAWRS